MTVLFNTNLNTPEFYQSYVISEYNRIILAKYISGSHYLHIITGRVANIPHNERLCKFSEIQTLHHVIFDCTHTRNIEANIYPNIDNLKDIFVQDLPLIAGVLIQIEKALQLH